MMILSQTSGDSEIVQYFPMEMPYVIMPILSSIASAIVLITCVVAKLYKQPLDIMLFWINLSDFLFCFPKAFTLLLPPSGDAYCRITQFTTHFGVIASVVWGSLFAHALVLVLTSENTEILKKAIRVYLSISIIVPTALSVYCLTTDYVHYLYRENGHTCVHEVIQGKADYYSIIFTGMPILFCCLISIIFYIIAARRLNQITEGPKLYMLALVLYPGVVLMCWAPSLITNLLIMLGVKPNPVLLQIFQALDQTLGFWDALIYGASKKSLQESMKKVFFSCWRKKPVDSNSSVATAANQSIIQMPDLNSFDPIEDRRDSIDSTKE